jgi:hypothetical protein
VGYFSKQSFTKVVTLEKDKVGGRVGRLAGWAGGWEAGGLKRAGGCALWLCWGAGSCIPAAPGHPVSHVMRLVLVLARPGPTLLLLTCATFALCCPLRCTALYCPVPPVVVSVHQGL